MAEFTVKRQIFGPPKSGNGDFASALIAGQIGGPLTVLRVPLDPGARPSGLDHQAPAHPGDLRRRGHIAP